MRENNIKKVISVLLAGVIAFSLFAVLPVRADRAIAAENLLINGDAEMGDLTSWKESQNNAVLGTFWVCNRANSNLAGEIGPHSGNYQFEAAAMPVYDSTAMIYQDVEAAPFQVGDVFEVTAFAHTTSDDPADIARIYLEFIAPDGDFVYKADGTSEAVWVDVSGPEWQQVSVSSAMPEGTKWVRVILRGFNYDGGTLANAFFDDVVLVNHGH
jgi:hypothetical protein